MPFPPFERIRLAVFDVDGTLVDAFEDIYRATLHVLGRLERPPQDFETIKSYVGNGAAMLMRRTLKTDDAELIRRATGLWTEYSAAHPAECARLYSGAESLLEYLNENGVQCAVLSNKVHEITIGVMERLGVSGRFREIWGDKPELGIKPDPKPLRRMMEILGAEPEQTLFIGDGQPDIEVARNAGTWSCGATWGLNTREALESFGADIVVDSLAELQAAFESVKDKTR